MLVIRAAIRSLYLTTQAVSRLVRRFRHVQVRRRVRRARWECFPRMSIPRYKCRFRLCITRVKYMQQRQRLIKMIQTATQRTLSIFISSRPINGSVSHTRRRAMTRDTSTCKTRTCWLRMGILYDGTSDLYTAKLLFMYPKPTIDRGGFFVDFNLAKLNAKTYNSRYSLVVTHLTTNRPVRSLSTPERTGWPIFYDLWLYVLGLRSILFIFL